MLGLLLETFAGGRGVMIVFDGALVVVISHDLSHRSPLVRICDGARHGLVCWDGRQNTYRAEILWLGASDSSTSPAVSSPDPSLMGEPLSSDDCWQWLIEPWPSSIPDRIVVGGGVAELVTVDALINRLVAMGFRPDGSSHQRLLDLRKTVEREHGSAVVIGRIASEHRSHLPTAYGELALGLADGRELIIHPRTQHPEHRFGWGRRSSATMRTARAMVDMTWSTQTDAETDAAVLDLATSVLSTITGAFVWRAESVADWIAVGAGDLTRNEQHCYEQHCYAQHCYEQLSLELG